MHGVLELELELALEQTDNILTKSQSGVCAVSQYAVFEANGKVNAIGEISHPYPPKSFDQFGCRFKSLCPLRESMRQFD